jgi:hypothetical protein
VLVEGVSAARLAGGGTALDVWGRAQSCSKMSSGWGAAAPRPGAPGGGVLVATGKPQHVAAAAQRLHSASPQRRQA